MSLSRFVPWKKLNLLNTSQARKIAAFEHSFSFFGFRKSLEDLKASKQQEIEVREDITYMKCYIDWRVTLCLANLLVSLSLSRTLAFIRDLEILRRRRLRVRDLLSQHHFGGKM